MTITAEDMRQQGTLTDLTNLTTVLERSEPIEEHPFDVGKDVSFEIDPGWNANIATLGGDEPVDAWITLGRGSNAEKFRLSLDALLEATSIPGLTKPYVQRAPAHLIQPQLKFWFRGGLGEKTFKVLTAGQDNTAVAVTRSTIQPFSNLDLLDRTLKGIETLYGSDTTVLADYHVAHTLRRSDFRVVLPEKDRIIQSKRHTDEEPDRWSAGIHIHNSLIGETMTEVDAYLFAWWCTNGCITTKSSETNRWNRKKRGQEDGSVYEWAQAVVEDALGGQEHLFDAVQSTVDDVLGDDVNEVLHDVFRTDQIPVAHREAVIANMVASDDLTTYGVMNAITQAANSADMDPKHVDKMMRAGGGLAVAAHERCSECHRLRLN